MNDKITVDQAINHGAALASLLRQECEKQYERAELAEKLVDELRSELSALRNSVRQQSVRATEQRLREVTAERDEMFGLLAQSKCPNAGCDGHGTIATEYLGEVCLEQCQWCEDIDVVFSRHADRIASKALAGGKEPTQ